MFTWICPKCGGEVPPAYDDCPRCNPPKSTLVADTAAATATPAAAPSPPKVELPPIPDQSARLPPAPPERRGAPAALVAVLAFVGIGALLAVLYFFVLPRESTKDASAPQKAAVEQPAPGGAATPANPFAKHLEITGIRLTGVTGGKVKIQYLVVNHSAAELPDMKAVVTLASGDRTYFEFPAAVPSLGPYEVKDLTASVATELKPYELPDWQMFRPSVRVTE